jgi:hypothetical protein
MTASQIFASGDAEDEFALDVKEEVTTLELAVIEEVVVALALDDVTNELIRLEFGAEDEFELNEDVVICGELVNDAFEDSGC